MGDDPDIEAVPPTAPPIGDAEADALFEVLASRPALLLAVSGGSDSIALLHLIARWARRRAAPPRLAVATVDHGLRSGARDDALFVAECARSLGLSCDLLAWVGVKPATGRADAARRARYHLLADLAQHQGAAIVTAHTRDDQAETVLMRLRRGSGPDGLAAMSSASRILGVPLLRPVLTVPKARLVATLVEAGVTWREDPSNTDPAHERVRVRRSLTARSALGLGDDALTLTAMRAARAAEALQAAALDALDQIARRGPFAAWGVITWPETRFAADEIEIRVLRHAVALAGGPVEGDPFAHAGPDLASIERLHGELRGGDFRGGTIGRVRLVTGRGGVTLLVRETDRADLPEADLQPGGTLEWDGRWTVTSSAERPQGRVRAATASEMADLAQLASVRGGSALPAVVRRTIPVVTIGGTIVATAETPLVSGLTFQAKLLHQLAKLRDDAAVRP